MLNGPDRSAGSSNTVADTRAPGSTLMVLAGAKGTGKSVLLNYALKNGIPLFGAEFDQTFQAFSTPGTEFEFRLSPLEVVNLKTWASGPHLPFFAQAPQPPNTLLVHLDLMNFCSFKVRSWAQLGSPDSNLFHMQRNPQSRIFSRYETIVVNTLYTPWRISAERFHARRLKLGRKTPPNELKLYDLDAGSAEVFEATYRAWLLFLETIDLKRHLVTRWHEKDKDYRIYDLAESSDGI